MNRDSHSERGHEVAPLAPSPSIKEKPRARGSVDGGNAGPFVLLIPRAGRPIWTW